jgi:TrmH family RNA methyltransferase
MNLMEFIESKNNNFFKDLKKLSLKKYRDNLNLYIEEGEKQLLSKDSTKLKYIVVNEEKNIDEVLKERLNFFELKGIKLYTLSSKLFKEITTQENSQGSIAVKEMSVGDTDSFGKIVIALDRVQDPGNMGTILRTVEAVGLKDVLILNGSVDIYNPKTIRSSMGIVEELNIVKCSEEELKAFQNKGYKLKSTGISNTSKVYTEINIEEKSIIIFGSEGQGVSPFIKSIIDEELEIPILGKSESLNVGIAAGVILYKIQEKSSLK